MREQTYEEAMRNTNDQERKIELYEAYHRTYLVPEYADRQRQHNPNDELFVKARLLREEGTILRGSQNISAACQWQSLCRRYYLRPLLDRPLLPRSKWLQTPTGTDVTCSTNQLMLSKNLLETMSNGSYTIKAYYYLDFGIYRLGKSTPGNRSKCQLVINTVEEVETEYINSDNVTESWMA